MSAAALAEKTASPVTPAAATSDPVALVRRAEAAGAAGSASALLDEARAGVERLSRLSHEELRRLIADRVRLLETELREREARRAALEEAMAAQRVLEARRHRARTLRRKVNMGSSLMAVLFAGLVVASLF